MSHIGSFIFRRDLWSRIEAGKKRDNFFPHFFPIFKRSNLDVKYAVSEASILGFVVGRASWLKQTARVWAQGWPDAIDFLRSEGFSPAEPLSLRKILMLSALTSKTEVRSILLANRLICVSHRLIFLVPQPILEFGYWFFLPLKHDSLALYELKATKNSRR